MLGWRLNFLILAQKKFEALYSADDEWEKMGIDRYSAMAVFGKVSDEGGGLAHVTNAGEVAEALLGEGGPSGEKLVMLSTMLQVSSVPR